MSEGTTEPLRNVRISAFVDDMLVRQATAVSLYSWRMSTVSVGMDPFEKSLAYMASLVHVSTASKRGVGTV